MSSVTVDSGFLLVRDVSKKVFQYEFSVASDYQLPLRRFGVFLFLVPVFRWSDRSHLCNIVDSYSESDWIHVCGV